ncbi:MAG: hypothetical protein J2P48_18265 [Alphaproteobacteria bacterium]|nr:hypothetical protein [Alphaproteobacteria bacterium]
MPEGWLPTADFASNRVQDTWREFEDYARRNGLRVRDWQAEWEFWLRVKANAGGAAV